jgi:type I restriction enzyme, R subunit
VDDAQQHTINFANNKLLGEGNFIPAYKTSKARVCVTVGMMTTGYDCSDILNLGLSADLFTDRTLFRSKAAAPARHNFLGQLFDDSVLRMPSMNPGKKTFKLFDFFANCEYFEEKYNYDEVIKLPQPGKKKPGESDNGKPPKETEIFEYLGAQISLPT